MTEAVRKEGFDFGFDPDACKTCRGNCCNGESGTVSLNKKEIERIAGFLGMDISRFISDYLRKISYRFSIKEIKINDNYACIFFDEKTNRCAIYPLRPEQCRTFPFWSCFREDPSFLLHECPGVFLCEKYITRNREIKK